jgi:hypothetical protein
MATSRRMFTLLCLVFALLNASYAQRPLQGRALHINRAIYGREGRGKDVTERLRAMVRDNRVDVEVNNDTMGGDPNEHTKKTLKVDYTFMGRRQSKVVNEHDRLQLP